MKNLKTALDFLRDAARSAAYLYRELAVSAYQLVPYAQDQLRERRANPLRDARYSLTTAPLTSESRLA